jgi:hypothetical protein
MINPYQLLWTTLGSSAIIGAIIWFGRTWIKKELEKSIDNIYDTKLETHKSQLREKEEELKSNLTKRIETEKAKLSLDNTKEIEKVKSKLSLQIDTTKMFLVQYSGKQFELYNQMWLSLVDLKKSINNLWHQATIDNLKDLSKKLTTAYDTVEKSAILIEPRHYQEMQMILEEINEFQFGKERLLELRQNFEQRKGNVTQGDIRNVIQNNEMTKQRFEKYLDEYRLCLQRQIKGDTE